MWHRPVSGRSLRSTPETGGFDSMLKNHPSLCRRHSRRIVILEFLATRSRKRPDPPRRQEILRLKSKGLTHRKKLRHFFQNMRHLGEVRL